MTARARLAPVLVLLAACGARSAAPASSAPNGGQIKHVVVLTMENRSFDHFLGWLPGTDGEQAGLSYPDASGALHPTHALAPDFQGCAFQDPDHSYQGGRVEYDGGRNDGWLRASDGYAIGYYTQADLPFLGRAATAWTALDRYYPSILSETFPNRIYQHAGQTDRISNTLELSSLPTIWDRLAEKGLKGRYYFSDLPFLALWGSRYVGISARIDQFYADARAGTLPEVAYVDGEFAQEATGTGNDDHPHVDVRSGEKFMADVYAAVTQSPEWSDTVLVITFDEWGGFFDHVPPPTEDISPATRAAGDVDGRLGFRVPALLVSPWARRGHVGHAQYDHTSVLRMIEANWDLAPLTGRDASAADLADELDLSHPSTDAPAIVVPAGPFGVPCPSTGPANGVLGGVRFRSSQLQAERLRSLAQQHGFPLR
jgi:phospholipase C